MLQFFLNFYFYLVNSWADNNNVFKKRYMEKI